MFVAPSRVAQILGGKKLLGQDITTSSELEQVQHWINEMHPQFSSLAISLNQPVVWDRRLFNQ